MWVTNKAHGQYYLSNHSAHVPAYDFRELWSRKVDGVKILTVFQMP